MLTRRTLSASLLSAALPVRASAQVPRVAVRIGYVPVIGASPLFIAHGLGWAREAGLDLALTKFESGPPAIQALASGTLDVLFVGIAPIAVARAKGLPIRVVAASGIGGSGFAVQAPLAAAFETAGGRAKEAFAAFRRTAGRPAKLGVLPPGGTPTVALRYWLKRQGVDPADVTFAAMGIDTVQQAMLSGAIDGGTVLEPALTIVGSRKPDVRTIAVSPEMYPNLPGVVVAMTEPFIATHPDAAVALVRLAARARELIISDAAAAAAPVAATLSGGLVEPAIYGRALRSKAITFVIDPRGIVDATRDSLLFEVEIGDFAVAPSIDGLFDHSVYDRATAK